MPGFRLQSKNLLLTYPQCPIDKQIVLDLLKGILTPFGISYIVVSSELHQDGSPHLHAFVSLNKKYDSRQPTCLDIADPADDTVYHGNYQGARQPKASVDYVKKDGDYIEEGEFGTNTKRSRDDAFAEAFAAATREEAEEIIRTNAPRDYAMGFGNISKCLDKVFRPPIAPYQSPYTIDDFNIPDDFWDWFYTGFSVSMPTAAGLFPYPKITLTFS